MKVGLFICDHVKSEYQAEFGDYPDMFAHLFPEYEWELYDVCNGHFPNNIHECDLYMTTGSKHSVYEDIRWIKELKKVIIELYNAQKIFVGFCFGHQLMGDALGGHVAKSPNGWCVGVHQFDILQKESWMHPTADQINLLMMCQDQILRLPQETVVLGGNDKCPAGIIQIGNTMLGIQGHPEYSAAYDQRLIEDRVDRMGQEVAAAGIASMSTPVDQEMIRAWIIGFIGQCRG